MVSRNDWLPLRETFDRLATYEALPPFSSSDAMRAARDIVGRGQIPVRAVRSDIPGSTTPESVEELLSQAKQIVAFRWSEDEIIAEYDREQDRRSILGPRSGLQSETVLAWSYGATDWTIRFSRVRVHWPVLVEALAEVGYPVRAGAPASSASERLAYKGELASYMKRFKPALLAGLSDDDVARRFRNHVDAQVAAGKLVLKLPQLRHIANQVAKLRPKPSGAS
jgi:hypothetical protein